MENKIELKTFFTKIKAHINKSFFLGILLCFGIFSKYILGPNNLVEEVAEFVYFMQTGKDINFSEEEEKADSTIKQLQEFIMINGK